MSKEVQAEILALTKIKSKAGETAEDFTLRAIKKVNALADADNQNWESLSEKAQAWINSNMSAQEAGADLDCLELPDAVEDDEASEAAQDEPAKADVEQETEVSTKSAKKVPAKKKAAAKPKVAAEPKTAAPKKAAPAVKPKAAAPAPKAKAPVKAAKKPAAAKSNGESRGRKPLFSDEGKIKILVKDNPHREGTVRDKAFKKIKSGMMVAEAVKAGVPRQQVWSMWKRGVISVTGASA